jgi:hypothetical protein
MRCWAALTVEPNHGLDRHFSRGSGEIRVETFDVRKVCDDTGDSVPNESQDVDNGFLYSPPIDRAGGSKYDSDIIGSESDVLNFEVVTDLGEGTAHSQHFVCAHEAAGHTAGAWEAPCDVFD